MDKLEKFITDNRELFDDAEPLAGLKRSWISNGPIPGLPSIKISS